jgi:hypothetical protein
MSRRALAPFLTFHRSLAAQSLTFRPVSCCSEKLNQPSNLNPNKKNLEGRATCRTCPQAVDRSTKSASLMLGVSTQSCSLVTASDVPKEWPPRAAMSLDPLTLRSASPHSPHLFDGIGPRTDWPKFKSEMRCESTWQCQTAHLPVPSENCSARRASGLCADEGPASAGAEPWENSTRMLPHRMRSTSPPPSPHVTHPHPAPMLSRGDDRFSGKQFSGLELCSGPTKNHGAAFGPASVLSVKSASLADPPRHGIKAKASGPNGPTLIPPAGRP